MNDRFRKIIDERQTHQAKLEAKHGLTGHPKADKLYMLAWDMGHSSGYSEIENYYDDMADLLKPNPAIYAKEDGGTTTEEKT